MGCGEGGFGGGFGLDIWKGGRCLRLLGLLGIGFLISS